RTAAAGFRTFDDQGHVLTLRSDGTIPIARLVANRFEHADGPIRLCYFAHAYRAVKVRSGQPREFLQGGMELTGVPAPCGGAEVLERVNGPAARAVDGLRELYELVSERGVADRVIFDLGLVRELGYYTGVVFEVYDPAVGFAIGGGGRYDDLLARFGRPRPACGIALDIHRVHVAQLEEERQAS